MNMAGVDTRRVMARLHPGLGGFWGWWRRCLVAWLPRGWRKLLGWSQDRLLLSRDGDEFRVRWEDDGQLHELARIPAAAGPLPLDRLLGARAAALPRWWLLPATTGLRRRLRLPETAAKHLREVAGFEIDRQTPFLADDVRYDVRTIEHRDDGQLEVELAVVPHRLLDGVLAGQGGAMVLAGVDLADAEGRPLGFNLLPASDRRRRSDPMRRWNLLLVVIALAAMVAAGARMLDNRRAAADALQQRVDGQLAQARLVAAQRDRLAGLVEGAAFLDQKRAARPAVVEVWAEATRRLPAGTWLEKFSIEGDTLLLTGYSNDAPSLVARMEGSPLWRKPALTGVLQADAASGRNRFTLTARLAGGATAASEAADGDGAE